VNRERAVAWALCLACVGSVAFIVAYAAHVAPRYGVLGLAAAALAFAFAAAAWVGLLPPERVVDNIDEYPSGGAARADETRLLRGDLASVTRRGALARWLAGALALFGVALLLPVRSLGPAPDGALSRTKWRRGQRLRREDGTLVRVDDLNVDSTVTVFPESALGDGQSQVVLVRLPEGLEPATRGYVAYSRLCTHAGCPVALYRAAARQLLCPCHQSVFDVTREGAVVSGPADHALPRLPIAVDEHGFLLAEAGFAEPVGPGFWDRP
jgi:ubiquinol-cytochrome c reductase iron-sulfur subunit